MGVSLSSLSVSYSHPKCNRTLPVLLREVNKLFPHRPAYVYFECNEGMRAELSYADLFLGGMLWASVLHDRGIGRGQFVVNTLHDCPERVFLFSAIMLSGAAYVSVCRLPGAADLKTILQQSQAMAVVLDPAFRPDIYDALLQDVTKPEEDGRVSSQSLPHLKFLLLIQTGKDSAGNVIGNLLSPINSQGTFCENDNKEDDVCFVFTTSGYSGLPKLVPYTHGDMVSLYENRSLFLSPYRRFQWFLTGTLEEFFLYAHEPCLCDNRAELFDAFTNVMICCLFDEGAQRALVPFRLIPAIQHMKSKETSIFFEMIILTMHPITQQTAFDALQVSRRVDVQYKCTETFLISRGFVIDGNRYKDYYAGKVIKGVEVKICDDQVQAVQANIPGEILVKSPFMFREYLNDPRSTANAFTPDGYFRTGDLGWLDSEGHLYVGGRIKDAIMLGTKIVHPCILESSIRKCFAVSDVMVVGVTDATVGTELCACVVPRSSAWKIDEIKNLVDEYIMPKFTNDLSIKLTYYLAFDSFSPPRPGEQRRLEMKRIAENKLKGL